MGVKKWSEVKQFSKATDLDGAEARAELAVSLRPMRMTSFGPRESNSQFHEGTISPPERPQLLRNPNLHLLQANARRVDMPTPADFVSIRSEPCGDVPTSPEPTTQHLPTLPVWPWIELSPEVPLLCAQFDVSTLEAYRVRSVSR